MATRQARWTRAQARQVVDELELSGLTVAAFARARDLHPKRVGEWRRRFDAEAVVEAPRMVELVTAAPALPSGSLKLCCPSGHVIEVTGVDLTNGVRALLAALPRLATGAGEYDGRHRPSQPTV